MERSFHRTLAFQQRDTSLQRILLLLGFFGLSFVDDFIESVTATSPGGRESGEGFKYLRAYGISHHAEPLRGSMELLARIRAFSHQYQVVPPFIIFFFPFHVEVFLCVFSGLRFGHGPVPQAPPKI